MTGYFEVTNSFSVEVSARNWYNARNDEFIDGLVEDLQREGIEVDLDHSSKKYLFADDDVRQVPMSSTLGEAYERVGYDLYIANSGLSNMTVSISPIRPKNDISPMGEVKAHVEIGYVGRTLTPRSLDIVTRAIEKHCTVV